MESRQNETLQNENLSDHEEFHMKAVDVIQSLHDRVRAPISISFFEDDRLMIVQCNKKALNKCSDHEEFEMKAGDGIQSLHGHVRAPISISFFEDDQLMIVQCNKKALNEELIEAIVNTAVEKSYRIRYYNTQ